MGNQYKVVALSVDGQQLKAIVLLFFYLNGLDASSQNSKISYGS
jgi:hypothetical protein